MLSSKKCHLFRKLVKNENRDQNRVYPSLSESKSKSDKVLQQNDRPFSAFVSLMKMVLNFMPKLAHILNSCFLCDHGHGPCYVSLISS